MFPEGFPIAKRWPALFPERIPPYSLNTSNGVKVSIMLEEVGLPYETNRIGMMTGESHTAEFLSLNPSGKFRP